MNIFSVKLKKRLFVIAAVMSVIAAFLPLLGVPVLISAVLVAVFGVLRLRVGYIIASLVNSASLASGLINLSTRTAIDPEKLFEQVGTPMIYYEISGVDISIGYYAVIVCILFMLSCLLINFLSRDEEE